MYLRKRVDQTSQWVFQVRGYPIVMLRGFDDLITNRNKDVRTTFSDPKTLHAIELNHL